MKDLPLSYLHIFPYSKRRSTAAAGYAGQVDTVTIKRRCARLRALDEEKRMEFYGRFAGQDAEVLVEAVRDKKTGLLKGRARNYIPVLFDGPDSLIRTAVRVRFRTCTAEGMRGVFEEEKHEKTSLA